MKEKEVRPHSHAMVVLFCSRASLTELRRICLTLSEDHNGARVPEGDQRGAALQRGPAATARPSRWYTNDWRFWSWLVLATWCAHTLSFRVGISPADSPAHANLAAELIPVEYRWPTLPLMFPRRSAVSPAAFKPMTPVVPVVSGKSSSGCSTRTRCCDCSRRSTRRRRSPRFRSSWRSRTRPAVNWTRRTGEWSHSRSDLEYESLQFI